MSHRQHLEVRGWGAWRNWRRWACVLGSFGALLLSPRELGAAPLPALLRLLAFQLIPSPFITVGAEGVKAGGRWQLTPALYSFGIAQQPMRFFLVAPAARHVGAIEVYGAPEWSCCFGHTESGWLLRAGSRVYWPVIGRGESLAMSLGGSYYYENRRQGGSAEMGFYTFASMLGVTVTGSPWLTGRELMIALSLRYY